MIDKTESLIGFALTIFLIILIGYSLSVMSELNDGRVHDVVNSLVN